jgi:hypothetical protein
MEPWDAQPREQLLKFDNSKLVAVNTCPTYGIMRYEHHKVFTSNRRNMPIEAGLACHEAFAACRLADLYMNGTQWYPERDVMEVARRRMRALFGGERTTEWERELTKGEDTERSIMLATLAAFDTSGYYDDDSDKRRTRANIEEALIVYVSKYPIGKIMTVVQGDFVGVEIPVNMYLRIDTNKKTHEFHYTGRIDCVVYADITKKVVRIEDNKTAARLDHQPTGYCLAASALLKRPVNHAAIRGLAIPIPKAYDYGGVVVEPISRTEQQFTEWAEWVLHTTDLVFKYKNKPLNAPKYTHSCNRYFHPCVYIPLCDSDMDERVEMYHDMETLEWDPIAERFEEE